MEGRVKHRRYLIGHGDTMEFMDTLPDGRVDMVFTDPPFGVTSGTPEVFPNNENNAPVDWPRFWSHMNRLVRPDGAIVVMCVQPFTTEVILSNRGAFRYEWIWRKSVVSGAFNAKKRPMRAHVDLCVFYRKQPRYLPPGLVEVNEATRVRGGGRNYGGVKEERDHVTTHRGWPNTILEIPSISKPRHPTQKPIALMEYLIETYTERDAVVLDPFMGSGSTGVAAMKTGRRFVGCEITEHFFGIASERMAGAVEAGGYQGD